MFRRSTESKPPPMQPDSTERVTSVVGSEVTFIGQLEGRGGVRIEGAYEGDIALQGLVVVGEAGRVTCEHLRANVVVVGGAVRGDITAEKVEIRSTGRVWGNVVAASFSTEEGAFLRGKITMEDEVDLGLTPAPESETESPPQDETAPLES